MLPSCIEVMPGVLRRWRTATSCRERPIPRSLCGEGVRGIDALKGVRGERYSRTDELAARVTMLSSQ